MASTADECAHHTVTIRDDPSEVERIAETVSSNERIAACVHEYNLVTMSGDFTPQVWALIAQTLHRLPNLKILSIYDHGPASFEAASSAAIFDNVPFQLIALHGNMPDTIRGLREFLVKQDAIRKVDIDVIWNWQPSWFPQLTDLTAPASVMNKAVAGRPITKVHVLHLANADELDAVIPCLARSTTPIEEFGVAGRVVFNCEVLDLLARVLPFLKLLDKTTLRPNEIPRFLASISAFKHLETVNLDCPIALSPEEFLSQLSNACPSVKIAHIYFTARYGQALTFILTNGKWAQDG